MDRLSNRTLSSLPDRIIRPRYDRSALQPGILHLGVGNFHRAHQAVYTDDILASGETGWGIIGASLRHADLRNSLKQQDYLYSVGIRTEIRTEWRVVGSLQSVLYAPENPAALIRKIASPETRIISLTITEKAYCLDPKRGDLDEQHQDIVHDLAHPDCPVSAIGYLAAGLKSRLENRIPLPTVLSCDNLTANGRKLRSALIRFVEISDQKHAQQLADSLTCPSTMVDRIVPQPTDADQNEAYADLGVQDLHPVITEPFAQWVMEDSFSLGRPEWERVGAECVKNVEPYERMKLSLLNASHTALAFLGTLIGYETVADAMHDPTLSTFISRFMKDDIFPVLDLPHDMDGATYITALLARFENPALNHKLLQIASDSSQKIPQRFLPTISKRLERGLSLGRFAYAIAGFMIMIEGAQDGRNFVFNDPQRDVLRTRLREAGSAPDARVRALLSQNSVFGPIGEHDSAFTEIAASYRQFQTYGVSKTLHNLNQTHLSALSP